MNSYGDFTDISTYIVNEDEFISMVRASNILLKNQSPHDNISILNVAKYQTYPRIGLILLAAKNLDNTPLFTYEQVKQELNPNDPQSRFGAGLRRIASVLTAASLVRNIPLESDIQQVSMGDNLETQAIEDLDRIIFLYTNGEAVRGNDTENNPQGPVSIFITYDVNEGTIPESSFDIPDLPANPPLTYERPVELKNVKLVNNLLIPTGQIGFGWFYLTASEAGAYKDAITKSLDITTHSSISHSIQGVFEITNADTLEDVILKLADAINSKTLDSSGNVISNILVSPNKGQQEIDTVKFTKCLLYPNTTTNEFREGFAKIKFTNNYLDFDVRKSSSKSTRDLMILNFYTVDTAFSSFINSTASVAQINTLRDNATAGLPGIRFGSTDDFSSLQKTGPVSILLAVDKANVIPVSIQRDLEAATNPELQDANLEVDTFYFKLDSTPLSGSLKYRVSTTNYPATIPFIGEIDLTGVITTEQVALQFVDSLYTYTESTHKDKDAAPIKEINNDNNILGVLLGKHEDNTDSTIESWSSVRIAAFKVRHLEYKAIIDILEVPPELCVATGNYINRKTNWISGARSIVVQARNDYVSTQGETDLNESELLQTIKSTATTVRATTSPRLQSVFDRIKFLDEATRGY